MGVFGLCAFKPFSLGQGFQTRDLHASCSTMYLSSPRLCLFIVIKLDLSVDHEDSLTSYRIVMRTEQQTKCLYHISYGG